MKTSTNDTRRWWGWQLIALVVVASGGCGAPSSDATAPDVKGAMTTTSEPASNADPDDVPITEADVARPKSYEDAVARIEGYRDTIRDEIAAGRPTKAHRGLDELDIVLNWLPAIARDGGVPKERWESINIKAQEIRELFNQVHTRIDAKQDPDYGAVAAKIDQAIEELKGETKASGPTDEAVKP